MFESDPVYSCVSTCEEGLCVSVYVATRDVRREICVWVPVLIPILIANQAPQPLSPGCVLVAGCGNLDFLLQESSTPRGPSPKNAYREVALVRTGEALVPFKVRHPTHTLKIVLLRAEFSPVPQF